MAEESEPRVIDEIVNPEIVIDPLGQMPFRAADIEEPVEAEVEASIEFPAAVTPGVLDKPRQAVKAAPPDPDRFLTAAKQAVVDNYNSHRSDTRSPTLTLNTVYIVWFAKTLGNWKAIVASPIVRNLLWEISYSGQRREIYIDAYKKINNVKVAMPR